MSSSKISSDTASEACPRYFEIDAVRGIALVLLIIYHVFISYQPFADSFHFLQHKHLLNDYWFIAEVLNIWRIPVLFVISGMSLGFILRRRTVRELFAQRMMRLVPPLIVSALFIVPIFGYLHISYHQGEFRYIPEPGHLWFVNNLISYTVLALPLLIHVKNNPDSVIIRTLRSTLPWGLLILFPLPLILETVLTQPDIFSLYLVRYWFGLVCYLCGFILITLGERFWSSIRIVCHVALPIAIVLYLRRLNFISWEIWETESWPLNQTRLALVAIESSLWMLAFIGYGSISLRRPSRFFTYLNQAIFPIYIIHMPVQQLMAYWLFPYEWAPGLTLLLHIILTLVTCVMLYEYVLRRIKWLYPLLGMAPVKKKVMAHGEREAAVEVNQARDDQGNWIRAGRMLTIYILAPLIYVSHIGLALVMTVLFAIGDRQNEGDEAWKDPAMLPQKPSEFQGNYYQVFASKDWISWSDARRHAIQMGGDLVVIGSPEENEFLTSIGAGYGLFYLGATDKEKEGEWFWVDGSKVTFENWASGEPNSFGGDEDFLAAYMPLWPGWVDAGGAQGFICEWKSEPDMAKVEKVRAAINSEEDHAGSTDS